MTTHPADEVISEVSVGGDVRCAVVVVGAPVAVTGCVVVLVTFLSVLVEWPVVVVALVVLGDVVVVTIDVEVLVVVALGDGDVVVVVSVVGLTVVVRVVEVVLCPVLDISFEVVRVVVGCDVVVVGCVLVVSTTVAI